MRVYEAIARGPEPAGVEAARGGAGGHAAGPTFAVGEPEEIRPNIARDEQTSSLPACGHAMPSDELGPCSATASPGAFDLVSDPAMAMSDPHPVPAVSGYEDELEQASAAAPASGRPSVIDARITGGPCRTAAPRRTG